MKQTPAFDSLTIEAQRNGIVRAGNLFEQQFIQQLLAAVRPEIKALIKEVIADEGGPRGTPENRPMRDTSKPANGIRQDKVVITHGRRRRQWKTSRIYGNVSYTDRTWAEGMAPQGCDQTADPAAGMRGRRRAASTAFWR